MKLKHAILLSAGLVLLIIAIRALTLMRVWLALSGVVLPAATILALTIIEAINTQLQGILLTAKGLLLFIIVMLLIRKALPAGNIHDKIRKAFSTGHIQADHCTKPD